MRRVLVSLILFGLTGFPAFAEEINLGKVDTPKIEIPKTNVKMKDSITVSDKSVIEEAIKKQKEKDLEDIENLWKGTVENDQVIGFALKKLSTPESQRRIHSSLMAKTLSAIVAGASLVPYAIGGNYATQTGAFAAGRIAQNLINKKNVPQEVPLTDTELIELAGLVENLQDKIISAYYNYKNSLIQLKEIRSKQLLYSKNYAKAMDEEDFLEITLSSNLYDNVTIDEFYCMQNAKKYRLELQRLAGKKAVDKLNLYQYDITSTLLKEGK